MRFSFKRLVPVSLVCTSIVLTGLCISDKVSAQQINESENTDKLETSSESDDNVTNESDQEEEPNSVSSPNNVEADATPDTTTEVNSSPDFSSLRDFLDVGNWEAADQETFRILLSVVGPDSTSQGRFDLDEWRDFIGNDESCTIVRNLDAYWSIASNGQLGFSAQRRVFQSSSQSFLSFYKQIKWLTERADEWLVSWQYTDDGEAEYIQRPDFINASSIEGHLPGLMEWEVASGEEQAQDRRFEMIDFCDL